MSISNPYYESWYNGDGSTVTFSFAYNGSEESGFDPISANYVKCHIIFSDGTAITPTFTVDTILSTITISALTTPEDEILNAPPVGAKIRIYRDVPETQELTPTALKTATTTQIIQAFDRIVAMIQEEQFFTSNGTVNLDERQRGMLLDYLTETNDSTILYYDYAEDKIKPTTFVKEDIVRSVGGMFLRQVYDTLGNPIFQYSLNGTNWESILCGEAANNHDNLSGRDLPSQHPAASIDFDNTGTDIQATTVEGALEELDDDLSTHIANTNNPHSVTKSQIGLGNVDNTSDLNKPISTDTQTALNAKANLSGATFTGNISATNLSGANTGDETQSTIKTKLGVATTSVDGYLTSTDWNTFNGKQAALGFTPANDSAVVHNTGNETIAGVKTFSSSPIVPTPTTDMQAATKKYVDDNSGGGGGILDTGDIKASLATTISGWILCNGQAVSRTTYSNLFTLIGETFGIGDGSTTFNIPDYRGAFLRGLDDGTLTAGNVYTKQLDAAPNITGEYDGIVYIQPYKTEAIPMTGTGALKTVKNSVGQSHVASSQGGNNIGKVLGLDASLSSASYGRDSTTEVRPMNFAVNWFIKA